jgi:hypothetical protein
MPKKGKKAAVDVEAAMDVEEAVPPPTPPDSLR